MRAPDADDSSGHAHLGREFGAELPVGLAQLSEADATLLADAIEATRKRQEAALTEATQNGIAFIPRLLRGPVQKVLFG